MTITSRYCSVSLTYYDGIFDHATIHVSNDTVEAGEKNYYRLNVPYEQAVKAMWKLAKISGHRPELTYNEINHTINCKWVHWYREF